ncbi:MAG: hypothetical protein EOP61_09155 [Sphingomonadales bacterium]|nr:MAG: hypothetical protein EOP61_09155 [Sphingomonadales bacterium]
MWRVPRLRLDSGLFRRRGAALLLTLLLEALLILLLLFMIPPAPGNRKPGSTTTFSVEAAGEDKADSTKSEKAESKARARPATATVQPAVPPPEVPPPPVPPMPRGPLPFIVMTRDEYRAAQISNMPQRPSDPGAAAGPSGAAAASGAMPGDTPLAGGKGPGGEPLYAAEWYRRPRQAELATYLPQRWAREGSGLIACRTVARYHVEDCKILGESPPGSGYGYAVLQASFQFLVRPPRVGGKEMVGAWVSIRIDYTVTVK